MSSTPSQLPIQQPTVAVDRRAAPLAPFIAVALGATALLFALSQPVWLVGIPALALGAIATARYPVPAVIGVFIGTGFLGTLTAFTSIPVISTVDFLLLALWLGVIGSYVFTRPTNRPWLWPGLVAPALFFTVTAVQIFLADTVEAGFYSVRATTWYMFAFLLVAIAPWPRETLVRLAKGVAVAGLLVGGYSTFRWATGVSVDEYFTQRLAAPSLDDRFAGSLLSANQLSAWCGTVMPFCLALILAWRGRWRWVAIGAIAALSVSVLVSDVRAGVAAAVIGMLVVMLIYQLSPVFPGRAGVGLIALALLASLGTGAYLLAVEGTAREDRLESLLNPGEDVTYSNRLEIWEVAIDQMSEEPLGLGLATIGGVAAVRNPEGFTFLFELDNSYLKIGLEQGVVVMGLFIFALLTLLAGLATRAVRATDPFRAALAIGACGSLVALTVLFYGGLYIEGMPIVMAWLLIGLGTAAVTVRNVSSSFESTGRGT